MESSPFDGDDMGVRVSLKMGVEESFTDKGRLGRDNQLYN